jgi:hypothetical protein
VICYAIYKSYHLALTQLNEQVYHSMSKDISNLNFDKPIQCYMDSIPSRSHINYVYGKLGIIDYNDYIFNLNHDANSLNYILSQNQALQYKVSSVVLADIVHQHAQLFADLVRSKRRL